MMDLTSKPNGATSESALSHNLATGIPVHQVTMIGDIGCFLKRLEETKNKCID